MPSARSPCTHPEAAAVEHPVLGVLADGDAAEVQADELPAELVLVAGHVGNCVPLRALRSTFCTTWLSDCGQ